MNILASLQQCAIRMSGLKTDKTLATMAGEIAALRALARESTEGADAVYTAERLLAAVARQRLILDLGTHPLYESAVDNIAVLAVGDVAAGSLDDDLLIFPGAITQRRQWIQKGAGGDGYQTLCTFAVEADGRYSVTVPAAKRTFTGDTEEAVRAQVTAAGVWAEWTRPDGSDSVCIDFGLRLPAVQALMTAAALGEVVNTTPTKRARRSSQLSMSSPHASPASPPLLTCTPSPIFATHALPASPLSLALSVRALPASPPSPPCLFAHPQSWSPSGWPAGFCAPEQCTDGSRKRGRQQSPNVMTEMRIVRTVTGRAEVMPAAHACHVVLRPYGG
jgi:hypothetical protein